ncbi:MAG: GNAT family N-acetyltransferase, partial [Rhodanobacteraceae bacterium]
MTPRPSIRIARETDARAIGVLVRRVTRQDVLPGQTTAAAAHLMETMSARNERLRIREGKRYHVAEIGGRIVGVVAIRDDSHVFRLFVARRWRGRGIARRLLDRAILDCRKRAGARTITLNASPFAVAAYRRLGFVSRGRLIPRGPAGVVAMP